MDSREVTKAIRSTIWPSLRSAGFNSFSTRTAWRNSGFRTDVVNFQSFNSYNASILKCTTFSFGINLGCYFHCVPPKDNQTIPVGKSGQPKPEEYRCHFRCSMAKSLVQDEYPRIDIWFVDSSGSNLCSVISDAELTLSAFGHSWFERFSDTRQTLRTLIDIEDDPTPNGTWGMGRKGSPFRNYLTTYLAEKAGDHRLSRESARMTIQSNCFPAAHPLLQEIVDGMKRNGPH